MVGLADLAAYIIVAVIGLLYELLMIAGRGQTIGKMVIRIKVVKADGGGLPEMGQAFVRMLLIALPGAISNLQQGTESNALTPVLAVIGLFGVLVSLSLLFDSFRRQGWHDKAASTVVINA